jgi:putative transposase
MQIEIVALRHQLAVLQRQKKRVSLGAADRLFWVLLSRIWNQWRSALVIVKPETVIAWHRKDFASIGVGRVGQGSVVDHALVVKQES